MEGNIVDYAVAEIQRWQDDTLIGVAAAARSLLSEVIDSGSSPVGCPDWRKLQESFDVPIACNSDAWDALSEWDALSGGDDFVFGLSNDRPSLAKIAIIAFVVRCTMNRFGENGIHRNRTLDDWKNHLCSAIEKNAGMFLNKP